MISLTLARILNIDIFFFKDIKKDGLDERPSFLVL
ncbi:hypothetical protein C8C88_2434 [Flavobacterium sp. 123]|nr:hypothetical protein C8C88_2434 [Flavobacterium sp. 123]